MDVNKARLFGNGRRVLTGWKTNQITQSANFFGGGVPMLVGQQATLDKPSAMLCKRVRSSGSRSNYRCNSNNSVVQNFQNFKKSGLPQRVLFYQNGGWNDIPEEIVAILKGDFQMKKAVTEVMFKGQSFLFDFIHMVRIDTETCVQQPVAWIDETGNCFFPESYSNAGCLLSFDGGENQCYVNLDPNGARKIKVHLEIATTGDDILVSEEGDEASVCHSKRLKIEGKKPASDDCKLKQDYRSTDKPDAGFDEGIGENVPCPISISEFDGFGSKHGKLDKLVIGGSAYNAIQRMFLEGFGSIVNVSDIVGIFHSLPSSILVQARLERFQKQAEITRTHRGNANVRYAWFASSKGAVSRIMFHRFVHTEMSNFKPTYGTGIHLTPASCSRIGNSPAGEVHFPPPMGIWTMTKPSKHANYHFDENGLQHMLLCRVIMGNMELIHPGSEQLEPSNENYDSGVDDLQNPNRYIVWEMYMNSHIYPEYVVSFRVPPKAKGSLIVKEAKIDSALPSSRMQHDFAPVNLVGVCQQCPGFVKRSQENARGHNLRAPNTSSSPWLPFPLLLDSFKNKIPHADMDLVDRHYDEFKRKIISRLEFIEKLRSIVGDNILRSTILSFEGKYRSPPTKCQVKK